MCDFLKWKYLSQTINLLCYFIKQNIRTAYLFFFLLHPFLIFRVMKLLVIKHFLMPPNPRRHCPRFSLSGHSTQFPSIDFDVSSSPTTWALMVAAEAGMKRLSMTSSWKKGKFLFAYPLVSFLLVKENKQLLKIFVSYTKFYEVREPTTRVSNTLSVHCQPSVWLICVVQSLICHGIPLKPFTYNEILPIRMCSRVNVFNLFMLAATNKHFDAWKAMVRVCFV